jgi:hypothetical protein
MIASKRRGQPALQSKNEPALRMRISREIFFKGVF